MNFKDYMRLHEGDQEDYWAKRMAQFQAASAGEKGAISDERGTQATYHAQRPQASAAKQEPIQWTKDNMGQIYEKPRSTDAQDLYFNNTFDRPASDGSYYYRDKTTGRFMIRRTGLTKSWR